MHKDPKNAHINAKISSKNLKLSIHNVASTETNLYKNMAFYVTIGYVRFARYCTVDWDPLPLFDPFFTFSTLQLVQVSLRCLD